MMRLFVNSAIRVFSIMALCYVLIAFPVINNINPYSQESAHMDQHKCGCGCEGDMNKCGCHKTSGIVGFRFCDTQAESLVIILSHWLSEQWLQHGKIINNKPHDMKFSDINTPLLDDIIRKIEHPPRYFPNFHI